LPPRVNLYVVAFTGKVGDNFASETGSAKLVAPVHLGFAPMGWRNRLLGSISSTFFEQLLHTQIPKAQKRLTTGLSFLYF